MSGPKSSSYRVSERARRREQARRRKQEERRRRREEAQRLAEEERRRMEQGRRQLGSLADQVDQLAAEWQQAQEAHGDLAAAWVGEPTLRSRLQDAAKLHSSNDLATAISRITMDVAQARRAFAQQSTLLGLRESLAAVNAERAAKQVRESQAREEQALNRDAEKVSELLDSLSAEAANEERESLARLGEEVVGALPGRRKTLLLQMRQDIQRTNANAKERQRMVSQAEQWREELAGLPGPEVEALDRSLRRVAEGQAMLTPDMAQKVKDVAASATKRLEREYASNVIVEELQQLGYEVESGFETASGEAPELLLRKPGMPDDYHIELRGEAGASKLHARVVREADGNAAQRPRSAKRKQSDAQAEQAWCGDFAAALAAAERRGVHARLASRIRVGEQPVQIIAPFTDRGRPKRRQRRRQAPAKARSLG